MRQILENEENEFIFTHPYLFSRYFYVVVESYICNFSGQFVTNTWVLIHRVTSCLTSGALLYEYRSWSSSTVSIAPVDCVPIYPEFRSTALIIVHAVVYALYEKILYKMMNTLSNQFYNNFKYYKIINIQKHGSGHDLTLCSIAVHVLISLMIL